MPDTAFAKIEDAVAAVIGPLCADAQPLTGWTVVTEQSADEAVEGLKQIVIFTRAADPEQADELGQTFWRQTVELEFIEGPQVSGGISRACLEAMANAHAALAQDRTVGGRLQDLQEIDLAGTQEEGKDVFAASLQYRAEFYTPRDDWFTIIGQPGAGNF
jgi:hypothetical protein